MTIKMAAEQVSDPAEAFEQMRRQLALLTAAVEGFASRQQVLEARDYAPDLAQLIERQGRLVEAVNALAKRPAMALTPETLAEQILQAGSAGRRADHELLQSEVSRQSCATKQIEAIIGQARTREQQRDALIWAALIGAVTILALWLIASVLQ